MLLLSWEPFILITNVFSFAGDLTDAKNADDRTSQQFVEEWQTYQQSIEECKTQTSATFLDTRGNHGLYPQCLAGCVLFCVGLMLERLYDTTMMNGVFFY